MPGYTRYAIANAALLSVLVVSPHAQTRSKAEERFSFVVANADKAGPSGTGRLTLVVSRWSTDEERDRVHSALSGGGPETLLSGLRDAYLTGWVNWPGNGQYSLRYARRTPRPDGGEDIALITDSRMWVWWDSTHSQGPADAQFTAIRLRLNKDGSGSGTVSYGTKIRADRAAGIVIEDDANNPTLLTNLRRDRTDLT